MKLNKVLALALSGVLAVSMLAGCSNSTADEPVVTPEEPTVSTSSISADLADALNDRDDHPLRLTASTDDELDNALAAVIKKYGNDQNVANNAANYRLNNLTGTLYTELSKKLGNPVNKIDDMMEQGVSPKNPESALRLYAVNSSVSDEYIVELVEKNIGSAVDGLKDTIAAGNSVVFDCSYTVRAAIVEASVENSIVDIGVKYVAVLVTGTIA